VRDADGVVDGIVEEDGRAVGGEDRERHPSRVADERVALAERPARETRSDALHVVAVDLAREGKLLSLFLDDRRRAGPVLADVFRLVSRLAAEIERCPRPHADAAVTSGDERGHTRVRVEHVEGENSNTLLDAFVQSNHRP
jgi:hypothetical protein